ncbi:MULTISPECIES: class I SAM-dependent methyltransferase [Nostoc]|uniref:Class I SAM-dependent methyltransferase n=1 Tax=Nostoc paludosum FACHB-159 TaxID=2692908 RepID=A0ABR8K2B1_9NOSO|nr:MULTISPECIES: class I SAM-dependent methyltransferase [Nostoc]MBD2681805.1 class I SAM-dependent methyltransferase [Nostoc sp. FACHB-857]MBD2733564.1 class I SAM-dependent methyltransferase [Nostoc paludosum FACHB-159]
MNKQQTNDFEKIVLTGFMVSLARQFTDISYAKELAQLIERQGLVKLPQPQNQDKSVLLTARVEARYKAMNKVIAEYQITQVLELASGLLSRGLVMSSNPNITFIESDLPQMIRCKQQLIQQLVGERPNLHFLEIDATSRPSEFSKSTPLLKAGQPVMILCEGLLTHLTLAEKQLVCANIRDMLHSYGGVWITPDFIDTGSLVRSQQDDSDLQKLLQTGTNLTGRSLVNNNFGTLDLARQFVYEQGFRVTEHSMLNVIDELSCLEILGIDKEVVRKMLATQSVFALTVDVA